MHFRKINTLLGWLMFAFAALVYLSTIEPTASFWDCGEFIACANKLEIGHQPGAPFFLLLGRLFSILAGNQVTRVAMMINSLSALASAFTIMFLFWTITLLAAKFFPDAKENRLKMFVVFGSGFIGALSFAFTDTFWFSAVEGEVYATSSLFTAVVFWAMLRWESATREASDETDSVRADRWLILIIYLMGLSIGVHLLNLLTIPALVMIYYFNKYKVTRKGLAVSFFVSFILLGFIVFGFIPWIIRLAAWSDLLFVNGFGLPVNSGAFIYLICLMALIVLLIRYSHKYNRPGLNRAVIAFSVLLIGYSSYIVLAVRAGANPPVNMNIVSNPFSLLQYINREQYVSRPLLYGPYYNAPAIEYKSMYSYLPVKGKYRKTEINPRVIYDKRYMTVFPRMSSTDPGDIAAYKRWAGIKGEIPTFSQNLYFFFRYQVGYMYLRYFMWNFSGRQTENQGKGDVLNGNWISGIHFPDELRLGSLDKYPRTQKQNKGRNRYYLLPLLLGIAGIIHHYKVRRRDFLVVLVFFLLTGVAIVVYLNEIPLTPRERDYAVGGSFYVFCIWIGLGVSGLITRMSKRLPGLFSVIFILTASFLAVPALLARENLDDHDRSNRYVARDFAYDYLNSCAPDAILFTNADNDTFPIWYAQEVEGIRTDVRVILAPFLNADWYIQQLADWHYDASPVKLSVERDKYFSGMLNYIPYYKRTDKAARLSDVMEFLNSNNPGTLLRANDDTQIKYYPTNHFLLPVTGDTTVLDWRVNDRALSKNLIAILDIIATNNWKRPVYFLSTQVPDQLGLTDYLQLDGFAYRLVPEKCPVNAGAEAGSIDTEDLYDKLMNRFKWGNMNDPEVFIDYSTIRTAGSMGIRNVFARLAEELIKQGDLAAAIQVLDKCMAVMPKESFPYDIFLLRIIAAYYKAGAGNKALELASDYEQILKNEQGYYSSLNNFQAKGLEYEMQYCSYVLNQVEVFNERFIKAKSTGTADRVIK